MLSFGRSLQQMCSQSLVLPSLDLTRLLELLLDLQLLRLCSGRTKGRWGRERGRGRGRGRTRGKEKRKRNRGHRSRDRERERNRKHVRQRGRGELYTDRYGEIKKALNGQEMQRKQTGLESCMENTKTSTAETGTENLYRLQVNRNCAKGRK